MKSQNEIKHYDVFILRKIHILLFTLAVDELVNFTAVFFQADSLRSLSRFVSEISR